MARELSRRCLLQAGAALACGATIMGPLVRAATGQGSSTRPKGERGGIFQVVEARHYEKLPEQQVRCGLCPNQCLIPEGRRGYCGVRENREGKLVSLVYGNPCSGYYGGNPDPIEKKPLFHFLPGTRSFSIATAGCNIQCIFCQNWQISQRRPEQTYNFDLPPKRVAELAEETGCQSIAVTYTEPTVAFEYMYDTAAAAREKGIPTVMISNGYMRPGPMKELCQVLGAVKIDLKAFTDEFYRKLCHGQLKPVLQTLQLLKSEKKWFEIVNLIIPTHNDDPKVVRKMCQWIRKELGRDVPVHFTAFHPTYQLRNLPRTPLSALHEIRQAALDEGLRFVYIGNVRGGHPGESTWCPECKKRLIHRLGHWVRSIRIAHGKCPGCGAVIPGIWRWDGNRS